MRKSLILYGKVYKNWCALDLSFFRNINLKPKAWRCKDSSSSTLVVEVFHIIKITPGALYLGINKYYLEAITCCYTNYTTTIDVHKRIVVSTKGTPLLNKASILNEARASKLCQGSDWFVLEYWIKASLLWVSFKGVILPSVLIWFISYLFIPFQTNFHLQSDKFFEMFEEIIENMHEHRERKICTRLLWRLIWLLKSCKDRKSNSERRKNFLGHIYFRQESPRTCSEKKKTLTTNYNNKQHEKKTQWHLLVQKSPQDLFVKGIFFSSSRHFRPRRDTATSITSASHEGAGPKNGKEGQGGKAKRSNEAFHLGEKKRWDLVGGWTSPFEKYSSNWESSPNRAENTKSLKPPPRDGMFSSIDGIFFSIDGFWKRFLKKSISWWSFVGKMFSPKIDGKCVLRLFLEMCWEIIQNKDDNKNISKCEISCWPIQKME